MTHPIHQAIKEYCAKLEKDLIDKFEKGRKEHGDNWREVDFDKEIYQEELDLINYRLMKEVNRRNLNDTTRD